MVQEFKKGKNYKPTVFDFAHVSLFSSETCSIQVTEQQRQILITALEPASWRKRWKNADDADVDGILPVVNDLRRRLLECTECDSAIVCRTYSPYHANVSYYPNAPGQEDYTSDRWQYPPIRRAADSTASTPPWSNPYLDDDVIVLPVPTMDAIQFILAVTDITRYPKISVTTTGKGKLTLYLLQMYQGGGCFIYNDDDVYNGEYVNLQMGNLGNILGNILEAIDGALTSEVDPLYIHELEFNDPGTRTTNMLFLPYMEVSDPLDLALANLLSIGWGGGFRAWEWCGEVNDMEFRQNSIDPCLLEYKPNPFSDWETMFNYDLCQQPVTVSPSADYSIELTINLEQTIVNDVAIYNNNPANIAPELNTPNTDTDAAMCLAIRMLIDSVSEQAAERIRGERDRRRLAGIGLAVLTGAAILFTPGMSILAGVGLATGSGIAIVDMGLNDWKDSSHISAFENQDARDCVARFVYNEIEGTKPTQTTLLDAFALIDSANSYEQWVIASALQDALADLGAFVAWLKMAGKFVEPVTQGLLGNDCPALCNTWVHTFDFTASDGGFERLYPANDDGIWVSGTGWVAQAYSGGSLVGIRIRRSINTTTITYAELVIHDLQNRSYGNLFRLRKNGSNVYSDIVLPSSQPVINIERNIPDVECDEIILAYPDSQNEYHYAKLTLRGTGTNPFT